MGLTNEHVGPKIVAKIKIYVLIRAKLLFNLCYEIPCTTSQTTSFPTSKSFFETQYKFFFATKQIAQWKLQLYSKKVSKLWKEKKSECKSEHFVRFQMDFYVIFHIGRFCALLWKLLHIPTIITTSCHSKNTV